MKDSLRKIQDSMTSPGAFGDMGNRLINILPPAPRVGCGKDRRGRDVRMLLILSSAISAPISQQSYSNSGIFGKGFPNRAQMC